jgi:hypothetical protein
VKTAISVPDETFRRASARAAALGVSRSEFFSVAADRYLQILDSDSLTARIDEALSCDDGDDSTSAAVEAAHRLLARQPSDW